MASADYRLCDVCGGKAFYDANLGYRWADTDDLDDWGNKIEEDDFVRGRGYILDYLGDWAVVCTECAKTHRVVVESIKGSKKADTKTEKAITALHQALAEPDMGIDRGAWSDVPDATKWVDELRGDEEPPNSATDVVEPVAWVLLDLWKTGQHWPDDCFNSEGGEGMTPLYIAPIKRKGGQYAKECETEVQRLKEIIDELENDDPPPKREWVGLTDEEIAEGAKQSWVDKQAFESAVWWAEEKLRAKNGF